MSELLWVAALVVGVQAYNRYRAPVMSSTSQASQASKIRPLKERNLFRFPYFGSSAQVRIIPARVKTNL